MTTSTNIQDNVNHCVFSKQNTSTGTLIYVEFILFYMFERIVIFIWSNKEEAHATRLKDIDISTSTIDLAIVKPLTHNVILTTKVK